MMALDHQFAIMGERNNGSRQGLSVTANRKTENWYLLTEVQLHITHELLLPKKNQNQQKTELDSKASLESQ